MLKPPKNTKTRETKMQITKHFEKGMTYPGWYHGKGHVQSIPKMLQFLRIRDFKPWLSAVKVRSNSEKNIAGKEASQKKDTATILSSWV